MREGRVSDTFVILKSDVKNDENYVINGENASTGEIVSSSSSRLILSRGYVYAVLNCGEPRSANIAPIQPLYEGANVRSKQRCALL